MKKRSTLATMYWFKIRDLEKQLREKDKCLREREKSLQEKDKEIERLKEKLGEKDRQNKELKEMLFAPKRNAVSQKKEGAVLGKPIGTKGRCRTMPHTEDITERVQVSTTECTECHDHLTGKEMVSHTAIIEDIRIENTLQIREVTILRRWCSHCKKFSYGKHAFALPGQRLGNNILLYMLYHKYKNHLPYRKIAESLLVMHGIMVSNTELLKLDKKANILLKRTYEQIKKAILNSQVIYADETGWRIGGEKGYVWVFDKTDMVLFHIQNSRGGGVPRTILGTNNDRTISSDFYAGYNKVAGRKQRCWAHLLRTSKQYEKDYPKDKRVRIFHEKLKSLFDDITGFKKIEHTENERQRTFENLIEKIETLSKKKFRQHPVNALCKRLVKYKEELLTCILFPDVETTNNRAERALRPIVLARKISGGSRNKKGAQRFAENASVIHTAMRSGNLLHQIQLALFPS